MILSNSKCSITIDIDQGGNEFRAGSLVQGVVHVRVLESTKCNKITIYDLWKTHGKGNTSSGKGEIVTLHTGDLNAGDQLELPFTVRLLEWPPTYHGHYLNVDHSIEVEVDIPWAFDVRQSVPLVVYGGPGHDETPKDLTSQQNSLLGCAIAALVLGFFPLFFILTLFTASGGFVAISIAASIAGAFILGKIYLPRWKLGKVEVVFPGQTVLPGRSLAGSLQMSPKGRVKINRISVEVTCSEVCVSGSGSNRKTHQHQLWKDAYDVLGPCELKQGTQVHEFSISIPSNAIPTIKLNDNEIRWQMQLRVDIPRWPDYVYTGSFVVHPDPAHVAEIAEQSLVEQSGADEVTSAGRAEISFSETAAYLLEAQGDEEQISTLIDAVRGIEFPVSVRIQRTTLYSGASDRDYAYPGGRVVQAEDMETGLEITLYLPVAEASKLEHMGDREWSGYGVIVGYDFQHHRLQIRALE